MSSESASEFWLDPVADRVRALNTIELNLERDELLINMAAYTKLLINRRQMLVNLLGMDDKNSQKMVLGTFKEVSDTSNNIVDNIIAETVLGEDSGSTSERLELLTELFIATDGELAPVYAACLNHDVIEPIDQQGLYAVIEELQENLHPDFFVMEIQKIYRSFSSSTVGELLSEYDYDIAN